MVGTQRQPLEPDANGHIHLAEQNGKELFSTFDKAQSATYFSSVFSQSSRKRSSVMPVEILIGVCGLLAVVGVYFWVIRRSKPEQQS